MILWHNIIGRLEKTSLLTYGIRPPYYSWDRDTNLLRTRGNSAAKQRSHIVPRKSDVQACLIVILAHVTQSGMSTCPNNLQSTYQSGMSDFRDIVEFRTNAAVWSGPCPPAAPISRLMVETLNCNFKPSSQNLIYAKLR